MHSSNEQRYELTATNADRFMVLYWLCQMRDENIITQDVYKATQKRLEAGVIKEDTRHGLANLLRSPILYETIAEALKHPHLRPGFNAGTWGKKLTKGRFYQASARVEPGNISFDHKSSLCSWRLV